MNKQHLHLIEILSGISAENIQIKPADISFNIGKNKFHSNFDDGELVLRIDLNLQNYQTISKAINAVNKQSVNDAIEYLKAKKSKIYAYELVAIQSRILEHENKNIIEPVRSVL